MPYIKQKHRELYNASIKKIVNNLVYNTTIDSSPGGSLGPASIGNGGQFKGDLNYLFFKIIRQFEKSMALRGIKIGYNEKSDFIAALRDCADEYARRFLVPYEDKKIQENGDVE